MRRDAIKRVAILDFDVHHGNGTEACVRNLIPHVKTHKVKAPFLSLDSTVSVPSLRPWLQEDDANSVFFASVHGYEEKVGPSGGLFYPGTGKTESPSTSTEQSKNHQHIYNVGMRKHCRYEWRRRWEEDILEPLAQFKPDMIFISAGFDAHCRDKLNHGYIGLVQGDYTWLTTKIVEVANTCCKGRVISVLEGSLFVALWSVGVVLPNLTKTFLFCRRVSYSWWYHFTVRPQRGGSRACFGADATNSKVDRQATNDEANRNCNHICVRETDEHVGGHKTSTTRDASRTPVPRQQPAG